VILSLVQTQHLAVQDLLLLLKVELVQQVSQVRWDRQDLLDLLVLRERRECPDRPDTRGFPELVVLRGSRVTVEREENPDLQVTLVLTVLTAVMELTVFLVWTVAMVQMEKRDHQGQSDPKVNPERWGPRGFQYQDRKVNKDHQALF